MKHIKKIFTPNSPKSENFSNKKTELLIDIPPIVNKQPKKTSESNAQSCDYEKIVSLELESQFKKVKRSNQPQKIPLMVTYKAKDHALEEERVGLDLVMIIDVSGSMGGEKINLVRETLIFIIDELQEKDRLCLIKFDDVSQILTNLSPMTNEFKAMFKQIVEREIVANGNTNIDIGVRDGYDVLLNRKHVNDVTAMFLLSDGQDTCGNQMNTFEATLKDKDAQMKMKGMEYKINSFGYGSGHDEKVLAFISNYKNGNFYYIKDLKLVDECFIECLGFMMSMFAKNAEITVFLSGAVKFIDKYGVNWDSQNALAKATIRVGGIAIGVEKNNIAEIELPDLSNIETSIKIGQAILTFEVKGKSYNISTELFLEVTNEDDLGPGNANVEENIVRVQAAKVLKEVEQDVQKGDKFQARTRLAQFKQAKKAYKHMDAKWEEQLDCMMDEEIVEKSKELKQMECVLEKQTYAPGYANIMSMNSVQKTMMAKKK
jgi:Mg-chelatase subunit ChlD